MIASITLKDVYTSLDQGEYRLAASQLQAVLHSDPSADAWYLAAELTVEKDRDRAIRHLKRALLMNPRHSNTLTLLGQLGESPELSISEVAEEVVDAVNAQADQTPILRRLTPRQRLIALGGTLVAVVFTVIVIIPALIPHNGPQFIPDAAPGQAVDTRKVAPNIIFNQFMSSDIQMFDIERIGNSVTPGKDTLKFNVSGPGGDLVPVQVIVYESVSDLVRDSQTQRELENSSLIFARNNALLVYGQTLHDLPMEDRLILQFQLIAGA
jgi:tetratricopeptide (TPR) repeat protein